MQGSAPPAPRALRDTFSGEREREMKGISAAEGCTKLLTAIRFILMDVGGEEIIRFKAGKPLINHKLLMPQL